MGSPTIFAGKYTKLLTQKGLMQKGGAVNQFDGDRNYILNSSFEANLLDGWNRVKTTITSNLPTGTPTIGQNLSVAPSISSFYVSGGSAPFDTYGLYFGNPTTTVVAGEGIISDAFTVESGDLGKVLTFKLYYKSELGASTDNWSGVLGSQTWAVYIYDQTAGAWLQPTGFLGMNQNSGVGIVSGTFQSSVVSGQQYRIAVIALKNTTTNSALQIDNVYVGPQTAPIGPVVTDWVSYTPTVTYFSGGATNVTHAGRWRRVGDQIEIDVTSSFSNTSAAFIRPFYSLPSGLSFDTSKMPSSIETKILGYGEASDAGNNAYPLVVGYRSSTQFFAFAQNASTSYSSFQDITNTIPFTFNSGDEIQVRMTAPISGWSSQVQLSNDTDTRVVAFTADGSTTTISNATPTISFSNTRIDTHGAWNGSNTYTIPVSGQYRISVSLITTSVTWAVADAMEPSLLINGSFANSYVLDQKRANAAGLFAQSASGSKIFNLKAGDTVALRCYCDKSVALIDSGGRSYLSIERLSGPSVVAASETVAMRFTDSSGQAISANTLVKFGTKDFDSHNAYSSSTGLFTVPVSGKYSIKAGLQMSASVTLSTAQGFYMSVVKNGSTYGQLGQVIGSGVAHTHFICGSDDIICNAGDTIALYAGASVNINLNTTATANHLSIVRVGN